MLNAAICPLGRLDWRDVATDELGQGISDHSIPVFGGVLLAPCRAGGGMPEAGHQFGECGPGGRGQHGAAWATSAVPLSATLGQQDPANGHLFAALAADSVAMRR
jgi:hypothetical protein